MSKSGKGKSESNTVRVTNRKARFDYHIHESFECGIMLRGTEVKAIREGRASIGEAFARIEGSVSPELWIYNMDIGAYSHAKAEFQHEPKRKRKLLVHKKQLKSLIGTTSESGVTLVPLTLYFNDRGIAKVEIAVASGKGHADKRESMAKKDAQKSMRRAMTRKRIG